MEGCLLRPDGPSPASRLAWLLQFIRRDLWGVTAEEVTALGHDLLQTAAPGAVESGVECQTLTAARMHALQHDIRGGIEAMVEASGPPRRWPLPPSRLHLVRVRGGGTRRVARLLCPEDCTDVRSVVLIGVANLLLEVGHRLQPCEGCGRPFLRAFRQAYCDARCSMQVRNQRRGDR